MTGMGNVVREVAFALGTYHQDEQAYLVPQARVVVQHLAEKGLLAPAPLREEWGSEVRDVRPDRDPYVLYARDPDNAQWQIDHNPEWATGRIMHRYRTDWLPVERAEGDGSADQ